MRKWVVRIGLLSLFMLVLLVALYVIADELTCKKEVLMRQKMALRKSHLISRELNELERVLFLSRFIDVPSGEERYLKLLSFLDLLSTFKDANIRMEPPLSLANINDVYHLNVSFETDSWAKVGRLFRLFGGVVYPVVYVRDVKLNVIGEKARFTVAADVMVNLTGNDTFGSLERGR